MADEEKGSRRSRGCILRDQKDGMTNQFSKISLNDTENNTSRDDENEVNDEYAPIIKNLQLLHLEHLDKEREYEKEWNLLKAKFDQEFKKLYERRCKILRPQEESDSSIGTPALPEFWLRAFQHNSALFEMIRPHDEPIIAHLIDVTYEWVDETEQLDFMLHFNFSPNPYFHNTTLTKTYRMALQEPEPPNEALLTKDPASVVIDPPEPALVRTVGSTIMWKDGQDVTKKTVVRKQKHRRTHETRNITRVEDNPSFFKFFKSYDVPTQNQMECMSDTEIDDLDQLLEADYNTGLIIKDRIIPEALRYYLGHACEDEDSDEYDDDECDSSSSSSEEDVSTKGSNRRQRK